jgi:hypothetical protein
MALLIIDSSDVGVGANPEGGFVMKFSNIEGFPPGLILMVPFSETADWVYEQIGLQLNKPKIETATPADVQEEVRQRGLNDGPSD